MQVLEWWTAVSSAQLFRASKFFKRVSVGSVHIFSWKYKAAANKNISMLLFLQSYYYKYKILQQVLLVWSLLCAVTNVTVKIKFYLQTSSNVGTYPYLYCTRGNHKLDINPPGKISLLNWRHNYYFSKEELKCTWKNVLWLSWRPQNWQATPAGKIQHWEILLHRSDSTKESWDYYQVALAGLWASNETKYLRGLSQVSF